MTSSPQTRVNVTRTMIDLMEQEHQKLIEKIYVLNQIIEDQKNVIFLLKQELNLKYNGEYHGNNDKR